MDFDLDTALARLSAEEDHPGLNGIEVAVLDRVRARAADDGTGLRAAAIAALGAVMLGAMAAGPVSTPAEAAPVMPFGPSRSLTPSALLLAGR